MQASSLYGPGLELYTIVLLPHTLTPTPADLWAFAWNSLTHVNMSEKGKIKWSRVKEAGSSSFRSDPFGESRFIGCFR